MKKEIKEKLLLRKFSSLDYIEEFISHYKGFVIAGINAVAAYRALPIEPVYQNNYNEISSDIELWEKKVLPNFRRMNESADYALKMSKQGNFDYVDSLAGDLRGLSKDMDGINETFMDYIDSNIKYQYFSNLDQAKIEGDNILWTLSNYWDPGEILDMKITGPIDENDLIRYLKPGETLDA